MKLNNKPNTKNKPSSAPFGLSFGKKASKVEAVDPATFVFTPDLPKVNVIPQSVTEKYEVKGVIRKIAFAGIGLVAVFALVLVGGQTYTGMLNSQVTDIQAQEQTLSSEVGALTPYEQYKNSVSSKREGLSAEVSTDVNVGSIYGDLYKTADSLALDLSSISIDQQDANGLETGGCTNPDPFTEAANIIGCITLQGSGSDPQGSKKLVEGLVSISDPARYASPFISGIATSEEGTTTFDASISFTSALYTAQYANLELALDEVLAGASPDATPTVPETNTQAPVSTYDSAVTTKAKELVPDLTESDLVLIDTSAVQACTVEDPKTQLDTIQSIIAPKTSSDVNEIMATLSNDLTAECEGN